eukprot:maker-scaffold_12-snap-gene-10.57-mRNA-1 protein AED:0.01 eAED:0.01 QI:89/0/0.5/1/1/1/2/0/986
MENRSIASTNRSRVKFQSVGTGVLKRTGNRKKRRKAQKTLVLEEEPEVDDFQTLAQSIELTNELSTLSSCCFPPAPPKRSSATREKEFSFFTTTYSMKGIEGALEPDTVKNWIPSGYDVYFVCVQDCQRVTELGLLIIQALQSGGASYMEYKHFMKTGPKVALVTCIYVKAALVGQGEFQRGPSEKMYFGILHEARGSAGNNRRRSFRRQNVAAAIEKDNVSAALILELRIGGKLFKLGNIKLPEGQDKARKREMYLNKLLFAFRRDGPDVHRILLGDFSLCTPKQFEDDDLRNYIDVSNTLPGWSNPKFEGLLENDELNTVLKEDVKGLRDFGEHEISFPPTSHRAALLKHAPLPKIQNYVASFFHENFNLNSLYQYKASKYIPDYPDRILFSLPNPNAYTLVSATTGTVEAVSVNTRVPVYTIFQYSPNWKPKVKKLAPSESVYIPETTSNFSPQRRTSIRSMAKTIVPAKRPDNVSVAVDYGDRASHSEMPSKSKTRRSSLKPDTFQEVFTASNTRHGSTFSLKTFVAEDLDPELYKSTRVMRAKPMRMGNSSHFLKCPSCLRKISADDDAVEAGDKCYHERCFSCAECHLKLDDSFRQRNNNLFCESCYEKLYEPKCLKCFQPIVGLGIVTEKGRYHLEHFSCTICSENLCEDRDGDIVQQPFYYKENRLLCGEHATTGTICLVCRRLLSEDVPVHIDLASHELIDVHQQCLKCSRDGCGKKLEEVEGKGYALNYENGKLLCAEHGGLMCSICSDEIYIREEYGESLGVKYHKACCASCALCEEIIEPGERSVIDAKTGNIVCEGCDLERKEKTVFGKNFNPQLVSHSKYGNLQTIMQKLNSSVSRQPAASASNTEMPKRTLKSFQSSQSLQRAGLLNSSLGDLLGGQSIAAETGSLFDDEFDRLEGESVGVAQSLLQRQNPLATQTNRSVATALTETGRLGDELVCLLDQQRENTGSLLRRKVMSNWHELDLPPPPPLPKE